MSGDSIFEEKSILIGLMYRSKLMSIGHEEKIFVMKPEWMNKLRDLIVKKVNPQNN